VNTLYLICFTLGLVFSLLAAFSGLGHVHLGHFHAGGVHGHAGGAHGHAGQRGSSSSSFNGFTVAAFLCWFGGVGYLLHNFTGLMMPLVLVLAVLSGLLGASLIYGLLFKVLLPRERVLTAEDTRMEGVVARVSDSIHAGGGTGEVLFSQEGVRRHAAARSHNGLLIERGTEVVVLRYERGIAWVSPLPELSGASFTSLPQ
jgi:hypothetical protein